MCNCYLIADFNAFDGGNQQFLKFDVPPKFRIDCIIFVLCVKAKVLLSAKKTQKGGGTTKVKLEVFILLTA